MVKKLRVEQMKGIIWMLLVLWILCGFIFWDIVPCFVKLLKGPVALEDGMELEDMEGVYVSWEVKYPVDEYMETTTTTKVKGVSVGTKKSSSSWLVIDEERGICLSVSVPVKRYEEMDAQAELFYQSMEQETDMMYEGVPVEGTVEVLQGEELQYYKRAANYFGLPIEDKVYHIGDGRILGEGRVNIYGLMLVGTVLLLISFVIIAKDLKNSAKNLIEKYLKENPGVTMEQLESDFSMAQEVNRVWVGRKWTFCPKMKELLLDNRQVVWVHTGSIREGRNINFYVWWHMVDGSEKLASLSSEKKCIQVMEKYNQFPHIIAGNNPEYGYMLRNDREAFLDMKYRKNPMEQ